jgi:hypothetical protein
MDAQEPVPAPPDARHALPEAFHALPEGGRGDLQERILGELAAGPCSGRSLALRLGVRWRSAFRVLHDLGDAGLVEQIGAGRFKRYRLR